MARDKGEAPAPPADLQSRKIRLRTITPRTWWRVHRTALGPCYFSDDPDNRFSTPGLGVLYLGDSEVTAFWEVYWDDLATRPPDERRISRAKLNARSVCAAHPRRAYRVFDATDGPTLKTVSAPAPTFGGPYAICQAWARAIFTHASAPDGILYSSARHKAGKCLALFEGRAKCEDVTLGDSIPIGDSKPIGDAIAKDDVDVIDD